MKKISRDSFSFKLFICILTTAFFLLLVGSLVLYRISAKSAVEMNDKRLDESMKITAGNMDRVLLSCDETARSVLTQKGIYSYMRNGFSPYSNEVLEIQKAFVTAVVANENISHIAFTDSQGRTVRTGIQAKVPYIDKKSCLEYLSSGANYGRSDWYYLLKDPVNPSEYCFTNVREINTLDNNRDYPLLIITFPEKKIASLYKNLGSKVYMAIADGTIISSIDKALIGTVLNKDAIASIKKSASSEISEKASGGYVHSIYLKSVDAYLVTDTTEEMSSAPIRSILIAVIITLVAGLIFSYFWSRWISRSLTKPLRETKECIEQVRAGNMDVRCDVKSKDEVGYLSESFNQMMDRLDKQIRETNEQQELAAKSELKLLQSQINPHLLYNSLDSALYLLSTGDVTASSNVLSELSRYFKLSLKKGSNIVTLETALLHMKSYINLQRLCRLKDYTLEINGDDALLDAKILHMLLQPVVENAVLHGFDGSFDDGKITICFMKEDSDLLITVSDNGIGMNHEELETLRNALNSKTPPGVSYGLWNVSKRINIYYGDSYGITVDSEFGEYTAITLKIPYVV